MAHKNPEERRVYGRAWRLAHPERVRELREHWETHHPEHVARVRRRKQRGYYLRHRLAFLLAKKLKISMAEARRRLEAARQEGEE